MMGRRKTNSWTQNMSFSTLTENWFHILAKKKKDFCFAGKNQYLYGGIRTYPKIHCVPDIKQYQNRAGEVIHINVL